MRILPTTLEGVRLIELEPHRDERGWFARTWCEREFAGHGLNTAWPQGNHARTVRRGMIRGMHWQAAPHGEAKLVRCTLGTIWDVVVDIRPGSPAFGRWEAFTLGADTFSQLYVPEGFAHGYQCLAEACEVTYLMGREFAPAASRGFRWNDPAVGIPWPLPDLAWLSERDRELPFLRSALALPS